jgi:hypothetical protein
MTSGGCEYFKDNQAQGPLDEVKDNIGSTSDSASEISKIDEDTLGCVCKPLRPEKNGSNGKHSSIIESSFLVPSSNTTKFFDTANQAFHLVSMAIEFFVERSTPFFITAASNG